MKAASVVFKLEDFKETGSYEKFTAKAEQWLEYCRENAVEVVVFPALLGCLFGDGRKYINDIQCLSLKYKGLAICPGSFYEKEQGKAYHSSCIIFNGDIVLCQRQLYLAKWEKALGLSRGAELKSMVLKGLKTSIILSTDMFYPQVSRAAAMSGAELVLAPAAVRDGRSFARQLGGLWQNVQQNLFFGIECGFKGSFKGKEFFSYSIIHGPLEMTEKESGLLAVEGKRKKAPVIAAELDNGKRKAAVSKFNTLAQLNAEAYKGIFSDVSI